MKVLVLLATDQRRGAEIEGHRLARELERRGHQAEAIALTRGPNQHAALDVEVLGSGAMSPSILRTLRVRSRAARVVIAYGSSSLPASAVALLGSRTPFIYRSIGDPRFWANGRARILRTRRFMQRAAHVVALWPQAARDIQQLYRVPSTRTSAIPNARSASEFRPASAEERSRARAELAPGDAPVVAVVGALSQEKRVELAIRAVAHVDNARLLLAGDGPGGRELRSLAADLLGSRATFLGAVQDIRPVLAASDVVALPSTTEGMPGVALEAGLSCRPLVATAVGAVPWLFQQGMPGELLPVGTGPLEFAEALRRQLGAPCEPPPAFVSSLSWATVGEQWDRLLGDIVGVYSKRRVPR